MAADVAQKIIQANTLKNNVAVVSVMRNGRQVTEETYVESNQTTEELNASLGTRFDDPTYYTA